MATSKLLAEHAYTDAELLALAREAVARLIAGAVEVDVAGKRYRKADVDKLTAFIAEFEARVDRAAGRPRKTVLRVRREP